MLRMTTRKKNKLVSVDSRPRSNSRFSHTENRPATRIDSLSEQKWGKPTDPLHSRRNTHANTQTHIQRDKASKALSMSTHSSHVWIDRVNSERDAYARIHPHTSGVCARVTHLTVIVCVMPACGCVGWLAGCGCGCVGMLWLFALGTRYGLQVKHRGLQVNYTLREQPTRANQSCEYTEIIYPLWLDTHHLFGCIAATVPPPPPYTPVSNCVRWVRFNVSYVCSFALRPPA